MFSGTLQPHQNVIKLNTSIGYIVSLVHARIHFAQHVHVCEIAC